MLANAPDVDRSTRTNRPLLEERAKDDVADVGSVGLPVRRIGLEQEFFLVDRRSKLHDKVSRLIRRYPRATFSLASPIKTRSFLRSSLFVDAQVVGAARYGDVVAVCGTVVVPTLQVQLATGDTDVPVVEPQVGSPTVYAEPRGDPFRTADGGVASTTEDDHGHEARGSGEHDFQTADATIHI
jgi:hypothetical protein